MSSRTGEQSATLRQQPQAGPLALGVAACLALVPILRVSPLEDSFTSPKLLATGLGALVLLAVGAVQVARGRAAAPRLGLLGMIAGGLLVAHAASMAQASSMALAVVGLAGWVVMFGFYAACRFALRTPWEVVLCLRWLLAAAIITAIWALLEDATAGRISGIGQARLPDWRGYLSAGLGNSGHIAGFIGLALPYAIIRFLSHERFRVWTLVGIFVLILALVVCWSVGSTMAAVAALVLWALGILPFGMRADIRWSRIGYLFVVGIAAIAFYMLPHPLNPHAPSLWTEAFDSQRWHDGWPTRLAIWKTTWHMTAENWLGGVGVGNFTLEYLRQIVPSVAENADLAPYAGAYTNDAHNELMHIWSETGIAGMLLYLALLPALVAVNVRTLTVSVDKRVRCAAVAVGAGASAVYLDAIMTFPLRLPSHHMAFMFLLAASETLRDSANRNREAAPRPTAAIRWQAGLLLTVLIGLALVPLGRRAMAEYWHKRARAAAEAPVFAGGGAGMTMSPWYAAEAELTRATEAIAAGEAEAADEAFQNASRMASGAGMERAGELFHRALSWDPRYSNASSRLGALLLMQGQPGAARDVLETTALDLEAPEVLTRLGLAYYQLGEFETAEDAWLTAAARRPPLAPFLLGLARQAQAGRE